VNKKISIEVPEWLYKELKEMIKKRQKITLKTLVTQLKIKGKADDEKN